MAQTTECSRCQGCIPIPDAAQCGEFIRRARQAWQTAHPREVKRRGRPPMESELMTTAMNLIEAARNGSRLPRPNVVIQQLGNLYPDFDESTLRRQVKFALIYSKSVTDITESDKKFLKIRRRSDFELIERCPKLTADLIETVNRLQSSFAAQMEQIVVGIITRTAMRSS